MKNNVVKRLVFVKIGIGVNDKKGTAMHRAIRNGTPETLTVFGPELQQLYCNV